MGFLDNRYLNGVDILLKLILPLFNRILILLNNPITVGFILTYRIIPMLTNKFPLQIRTTILLHINNHPLILFLTKRSLVNTTIRRHITMIIDGECGDIYLVVRVVGRGLQVDGVLEVKEEVLFAYEFLAGFLHLF